MLKIMPSTRQLLLSPEEAHLLRKEIEDAFVVLDVETNGKYYSGERMEEKYPTLYELHREV